MATVLRTIEVYDCPCGDLHELLYAWRGGTQIGPLYLCGSLERSKPSGVKSRTVTLGLEIVGDVTTGR